MRNEQNKAGFTLVEIMIVVAIIAILAAIAIPNLLRARISADDALAKVTLKSISTAAEAFASNDINGNYPKRENMLTTATPPYLDTPYCANSPIAGYNYNCSMSIFGYKITATPMFMGITGSTVYTISTGGALTP